MDFPDSLNMRCSEPGVSVGLHNKLTPALRKWRRRGYALAEHTKATLKEALPRSHVPWLLTTGGCSCDLCCRPAESVETGDGKRATILRDDAATIIRELDATDSGSSFLYVHFYGGDISIEPLPIVKWTRRTPASISSPSEPIMRDELTREALSEFLVEHGLVFGLLADASGTVLVRAGDFDDPDFHWLSRVDPPWIPTTPDQIRGMIEWLEGKLLPHMAAQGDAVVLLMRPLGKFLQCSAFSAPPNSHGLRALVEWRVSLPVAVAELIR